MASIPCQREAPGTLVCQLLIVGLHRSRLSPPVTRRPDAPPPVLPPSPPTCSPSFSPPCQCCCLALSLSHRRRRVPLPQGRPLPLVPSRPRAGFAPPPSPDSPALKPAVLAVSEAAGRSTRARRQGGFGCPVGISLRGERAEGRRTRQRGRAAWAGVQIRGWQSGRWRGGRGSGRSGWNGRRGWHGWNGRS